MPGVIEMVSAAMNRDLAELRSVSQNLSNVQSVGYKRQSFSTVSAASGDLSPPTHRTLLDLREGAVTETGRGLDIAIHGAGLLAVQGPDGVLYTRRGDMLRSESGHLSIGGLPVLGEAGPVMVGNGRITIDREGLVYQDDVAVARLAIARIDAAALSQAGNGFLTSPRPLPDAPQESFSISQGYLEASNVQSVDEMLRLIEISRHFEMSSRVLRSYDGILDSAINTLADF